MRNIGTLDRIIRIVLALVIFYVATMVNMVDYLKIILAVIGGLILVTSITSFCFVYKIFGICSCKKVDKNCVCDSHIEKPEKLLKEEDKI